MKILNDVLLSLIPIASMAPFIAVGFYFGRLEKRIKEVEKKAHVHHGFTLIKNTEEN